MNKVELKNYIQSTLMTIHALISQDSFNYYELMTSQNIYLLMQKWVKSSIKPAEKTLVINYLLSRNYANIMLETAVSLIENCVTNRCLRDKIVKKVILDGELILLERLYKIKINEYQKNMVLSEIIMRKLKGEEK